MWVNFHLWELEIQPINIMKGWNNTEEKERYLFLSTSWTEQAHKVSEIRQQRPHPRIYPDYSYGLVTLGGWGVTLQLPHAEQFTFTKRKQLEKKPEGTPELNEGSLETFIFSIAGTFSKLFSAQCTVEFSAHFKSTVSLSTSMSLDGWSCHRVIPCF